MASTISLGQTNLDFSTWAILGRTWTPAWPLLIQERSGTIKKNDKLINQKLLMHEDVLKICSDLNLGATAVPWRLSPPAILFHLVHVSASSLLQLVGKREVLNPILNMYILEPHIFNTGRVDQIQPQSLRMDQLLPIHPLKSLHIGLRVVLPDLAPWGVALHAQGLAQGPVGAVDPTKAQGLLPKQFNWDRFTHPKRLHRECFKSPWWTKRI